MNLMEDSKSALSAAAGANGLNFQAVLNFIDLAGSERASMHENSFSYNSNNSN